MNTKDLTKNKNCYTYYLLNNLEKFEDIAYDDKVSLEDMRLQVLACAEPANMTPAKMNFIRIVDSMSTKEGLMRYIINAVNKARSYRG